MSIILGQCKCLDKFEKDTLIKSLDTSMFYSRKILDRPNILSTKTTRKHQDLISEWTLLRDIVYSTPACEEEKEKAKTENL